MDVLVLVKELLGTKMIQFELNITNSCPAKCYDCIMSYYQPPDDIIIDVISEAKRYEDVFVWATGGEPLLQPNFLEKLLQTGVTTQIVTMGVYNEDKILELVHKYPNIQKVNVSVIGTPEFEKEFRKIDRNWKREWVREMDKYKLNIIFVTFKDEITSGRAYKNIDYVFENFHYFPICVLYDRCDRFEPGQLEEFGTYLKKKSEEYNTPVMIFPVRKMWPTIFVSGEKLHFYYGKCLSTITSKEALKDVPGFLNTVVSGHTLNSFDSMIKCDVYKKYKGCGGPACRYGYIKECRDFWHQFILPAQVVNKEVWV